MLLVVLDSEHAVGSLLKVNLRSRLILNSLLVVSACLIIVYLVVRCIFQ